MTTYTSRFRFGVPDFLDDPWHEAFEALIHQIDNALYQIVVAESVSFWANSTAYDVSDLVIDNLTGVMYTCGVSHTSPASPTTFAQDRVANPARWNPTANLPQQKGNWVTGTTYVPGDFVVESQRYAVCLVGHVAGTFNTDLAAGKWVILIDLSTLGVGINTEAEATVASSATVDLGAITSSRIFITGNTPITSFGIVANQIKIIRYEQALTVTHHATDLILPAGANRTTDAGGYQIVTSNSAGKWREVNWHPGAGPAAVPVASTTQQGVAELATVAETQALTDPDRVVTPLGLAGALSDLSTSILNTIRNGVSATLDTLSEIATAINLLAPKASPVLTGTPTAPTPATATNDTTVATTAFARSAIAAYNPLASQVYHVRDVKASGTDGDALTEEAWTDRVLNTEVTDQITAALASNEITLPAGTYLLLGWAAAGATGGNRTIRSQHRLRNTTDGTTLVSGGTVGSRHNAADLNHNSGAWVAGPLNGIFTVAAGKALKLQTYIQVSGGTGNTVQTGNAAGSGESEVYAELIFIRLLV